MKLLYVNDKNAIYFDKENKKKHAFAKYFSPNCPACVAMEQPWDDMCKEVEEKYNTDAIIAQVDPTGMRKLEDTDTYSDVAYVPTIVLLENGKRIKEYDGAKDKNEMIRFLLENNVIHPKMNGGKKKRANKRTTNKRTTNKHTTNKRTTNKRTTNKRTTNKRTTNKRKTNKRKTDKRKSNKRKTGKRTSHKK